MFFVSKHKASLPSASDALPGREEKLWPAEHHFVLKTPVTPPFEPHLSQIMFGMGCFWGAERKFWQIPGVYTTAVGYTAGYTPNPTYEEVCTGMTGHNEAVLVVYDEKVVPLSKLLTAFWESHDPTQGMRQGNDRGTQYRSGIYVQSGDDLGQANETLAAYQSRLDAEGFGQITTEIKMSEAFYYAEDYHQQYLAKNPNGYCGIGGCGVQMIKK